MATNGFLEPEENESKAIPSSWILAERTIYNQIIAIFLQHVDNPEKIIDIINDNVHPELYGYNTEWVRTLMEFLWTVRKQEMKK